MDMPPLENSHPSFSSTRNAQLVSVSTLTFSPTDPTTKMAASGSDQYQQQYNQYQQQQQQYQQQQQAQQQVQQQQQYQQQTAQPDESIQQWKTWQAHEAQSNGISMTWNVWPASRLEATRCVVPFAAMYTPLHNVDSPSMALVNQEPLVCHRRECRALMNPYCQADYQHKFWVCNFCQTRNAVRHTLA